MSLSVFVRGVAFILSLNYFCFQVEVFEEEYEANHPAQTGSAAVSSPSLTWESFDKDQAPQPFVFDAATTFERLATLEEPSSPIPPAHIPKDLIRDKSPPLQSALS
jgi:hypothetical protein